MSPGQQRIVKAADTLHEWALTHLEQTGTAPAHPDVPQVQQLESGALVVNLVASLSEESEPTAVELFFPSNPGAFLIITCEHNGFLQPIPRKRYPQVAASILVAAVQQ